VGLKPQIHAAFQTEEIAAFHGARKILDIPSINVASYSVYLNGLDKFRSALLASGMVEFVEPDILRSIPIGEQPVRIALSPDDPGFDEQWAPACIGADNAWEYEQLAGRREVVVAVIDTGISYLHPDLVSSVDTSIDWDFVNDDDDAADDHGHGTHCAGIIAAGLNNATGIAGLQKVTLMAVKALNANGTGWDSVLARSIIYAVDNGAKVISNSWGSLVSSRTMAQATYYAYSQGVVVVAAAGNFGSSRNHYPAAYPWVIGVGALENCTTRASYSNYGSENVFVSAPGSNILSTYLNDSYASLSGTSMACPHVAAAAAMWISAFLDDAPLTPQQVFYLIAGTADDLGDPGKDSYYGFGRIDMFPWNQ
jgi:subtilisin family serine protease